MCQSKASGGRRCSGNSGGARAASSASTQVVARIDSTPDREQVDKLAAALPADRTGWDGSPLNDADKRLFALRESGYKGPIDQDGYPDTSSEAAGILRRMAQGRGENTNW
jgi:hypothetical protein